jgi:hypothetical protein
MTDTIPSNGPSSVLSDAAELNRWQQAYIRDPYDRAAREHLAAVMFRIHGDEMPLGTMDRSQHLLRLIGIFPLPEIAQAYFANLEQLLAPHRPLSQPGRLALGLGAGRCGSTSLAAIVATVKNSCCTHENRPMIHWQPLEEQVSFHLRRFALLLRYFPLVFDAAHWWLNVADRVLDRFPTAKLIGLVRDREACARSFFAVKQQYNHWSEPRGPWQPNPWDPAYPSYALPETVTGDPDAAKRALILAYVTDYEAGLDALVRERPESCLQLRTEALSDVATQRALFRHLGVTGAFTDIRLNANRLTDGNLERFSL